MFCENCGIQLDPNGKFCGKCGAKVEATHNQSLESMHSRSHESMHNQSQELLHNQFHESPPYQSHESAHRSHHEPIAGQPQNSDEKQSNKSPTKKKWFILGGVVLFLALLTAGAILFFGQNQRSERMFQEAINQGQHYLEAMDFTNAKLAFLRAIEIDPRQVEPYLALADMYIEMGEVVLALEILESGIRSVLPEDRWILEDRWEEVDNILETTPPVSQDGDADTDGDADLDIDRDRDEVMIDPEEPFEPCDYYLALLAYHEFLTNPQSMVFEHWGAEHDISWDVDAIRHGMLADFTGNGIPYLIILPPTVEMMWGQPLLILGFSGEIEVIYRSSLWGEGGQTVGYEVATSSGRKSYLIRVHGQGGGPGWRNERDYLTLQNGAFIPVLNTEEDHSNWIDGELLDEPIETFHVNSVEVSKEEFEGAPYRYLGIVNRDSLSRWYRQGEFVGIHLLLSDIEGKLASAGMMNLPEEDEILAAKRIWVEFFSSEQWRELPMISSVIDPMLSSVTYADLDGDGVSEALLYVFAIEGGGRSGQLYAEFSVLLAIRDGEVTVVYSTHIFQAEDGRNMLYFMRDTSNDQFVLAREERIGGFDNPTSTIIYDYRDGVVSQRSIMEGSPWQLNGFEMWW